MALGLSTMILGTSRSAAPRSGKAAHAERAIGRFTGKLELDLRRDGKRSLGACQKARQILIGRAGQQAFEGRSLPARAFLAPATAKASRWPFSCSSPNWRRSRSRSRPGERCVPSASETALKSTRCPSARKASTEATLSRIEPWRRARMPLELLPSMPPMVACCAEAMSTGKTRPCALSAALIAAGGQPGSAVHLKVVGVDLKDSAQIFREIETMPFAERLPCRRGAAAARDDGKPFFARHLKHDGDIAGRFGATTPAGKH